MICLAGPIIEEGNPMNLSGSGKRTIIIVAIIVPSSEASPPIITIERIGINCIKVNEEGSMKVM
jgi:hypothetical protein